MLWVMVAKSSTPCHIQAKSVDPASRLGFPNHELS